MKDLTYSQVKLNKFNNDLIKKTKIKKEFDDYYEKHKIKAVTVVKYLSDDFVYEDIRCLFNETNEIESNEILPNEIKSYEAKPYEVEYYEVRSNKIKSYEIDYIDIKHHKIEYYELRSNEIVCIDIKPREIKSYEHISENIESNENYCIENIKNEFNKLSNNLVEANTKGIRYIVDHINNGENLKETLINLEDIGDEFIPHNDTLPFGMLSKLSYIDLRKMNIISSVTFDVEYKFLKAKSRMMVKSLKALKMPLFLGFLKYISEEELSEEKLSEYIELNKNKV